MLWEKLSYCLERGSTLRGKCPIWGRKSAVCREAKCSLVGGKVLFSGAEVVFGDTISSVLEASCMLAMRRHMFGRKVILVGENVRVLEKRDSKSNSPAFCACAPQAPGLLLLAPASTLPSQFWHNKRPSFCISTQAASSLLDSKPASLLPSAFRHTETSPFWVSGLQAPFLLGFTPERPLLSAFHTSKPPSQTLAAQQFAFLLPSGLAKSRSYWVFCAQNLSLIHFCPKTSSIDVSAQDAFSPQSHFLPKGGHFLPQIPLFSQKPAQFLHRTPHFSQKQDIVAPHIPPFLLEIGHFSPQIPIFSNK